MIERAQRRRANDVKPIKERLWLAYLARSGTVAIEELYSNLPADIPRDWAHQRFRAMKNQGRIIKTRDGKYRLMGCV